MHEKMSSLTRLDLFFVAIIALGIIFLDIIISIASGDWISWLIVATGLIALSIGTFVVRRTR